MRPGIDRLAKLCHTVNVAAQGIWLGSLLMTGAVAATVFPLMRQLNPTLGAYPRFTGDHPVLAGGHVAAKAFLVNDIVQFVCAGLALLSLGVLIIIQLRRPVSQGGGRSPRVLARAVLFGLALAVFCVQFFMVAPAMDATLREFWLAAAEGNNAAAETLRARFASSHPVASTLMAATAGLLLISLLVSAWPVRGPLPGPPGTSGPGTAPPPRSADSGRPLEVPLLARGRA